MLSKFIISSASNRNLAIFKTYKFYIFGHETTPKSYQIKNNYPNQFVNYGVDKPQKNI